MGKVDWAGGKVTGAVYHGGNELSKLLVDAAGMFAVSNPLHPDVFPGVRQMESGMSPSPSCGGFWWF